MNAPRHRRKNSRKIQRSTGPDSKNWELRTRKKEPNSKHQEHNRQYQSNGVTEYGSNKTDKINQKNQRNDLNDNNDHNVLHDLNVLNIFNDLITK
ncbi:MAG: hypothetical protein WBB67_09235 [bacterium]